MRASATRSPGSRSVDESRSHLPVHGRRCEPALLKGGWDEDMRPQPQRRASTAEAGVASSESSSTLRRRDLMTVHLGGGERSEECCLHRGHDCATDDLDRSRLISIDLDRSRLISTDLDRSRLISHSKRSSISSVKTE